MHVHWFCRLPSLERVPRRSIYGEAACHHCTPKWFVAPARGRRFVLHGLAFLREVELDLASPDFVVELADFRLALALECLAVGLQRGRPQF